MHIPSLGDRVREHISNSRPCPKYVHTHSYVCVKRGRFVLVGQWDRGLITGTGKLTVNCLTCFHIASGRWTVLPGSPKES